MNKYAKNEKILFIVFWLLTVSRFVFHILLENVKTQKVGYFKQDK